VRHDHEDVALSLRVVHEHVLRLHAAEVGHGSQRFLDREHGVVFDRLPRPALLRKQVQQTALDTRFQKFHVDVLRNVSRIPIVVAHAEPP
jgi:hypothetical protein